MKEGKASIVTCDLITGDRLRVAMKLIIGLFEVDTLLLCRNWKWKMDYSYIQENLWKHIDRWKREKLEIRRISTALIVLKSNVRT